MKKSTQELDLSYSIDKRQEKEARSYPRYNANSTEWTWFVKGTRLSECEISIIRRNNRHGFISYGWPDPNNKIVIFSSEHEQVLPKILFENMKSLAQQGARIMNNKKAE